jgi:hypothetical protein
MPRPPGCENVSDHPPKAPSLLFSTSPRLFQPSVTTKTREAPSLVFFNPHPSLSKRHDDDAGRVHQKHPPLSFSPPPPPTPSLSTRCDYDTGRVHQKHPPSLFSPFNTTRPQQHHPPPSFSNTSWRGVIPFLPTTVDNMHHPSLALKHEPEGVIPSFPITTSPLRIQKRGGASFDTQCCHHHHLLPFRVQKRGGASF